MAQITIDYGNISNIKQGNFKVIGTMTRSTTWTATEDIPYGLLCVGNSNTTSSTFSSITSSGGTISKLYNDYTYINSTSGNSIYIDIYALYDLKSGDVITLSSSGYYMGAMIIKSNISSYNSSKSFTVTASYKVPSSAGLLHSVMSESLSNSFNGLLIMSSNGGPMAVDRIESPVKRDPSDYIYLGTVQDSINEYGHGSFTAYEISLESGELVYAYRPLGGYGAAEIDLLISLE